MTEEALMGQEGLMPGGAYVPHERLLPEGDGALMEERRKVASSVEEAGRGLSGRRSANTLNVYRTRWQDWLEYCLRTGSDSMRPDKVSAVSAFMEDMEERGKSLATVKVSLSALRVLCLELGLEPLPSTLASRELRESWELVRRRRMGDGKVGYGKARALEPKELRLIVAWLEREGAAGRERQWRRDRAAYGLMFMAALRVSELVGLERDDVTELDGGYQLFLRRSKGDRSGEGVKVYAHGTPRMPLVKWVSAWFDEWRDRRAHAIEGGGEGAASAVADRRLFAVGAPQVRNNLKRAAAACGLDMDGLRTHSMRAGLATWMSEADAAPLSIKEALRHRDVRTTMGYVRQVNGRRRSVRNAKRLAEFEASEIDPSGGSK